MTMTRRDFQLMAGALLALGTRPGLASAADESAIAKFRKIEEATSGRLGVAALDSGSGTRMDWRAEERFPITSTFKMLLAGAVLNRVDRDVDKLDRIIRFEGKDVVSNSPFTKPKADGPGMTVESLCEAAMIVSDNTAANVLLAEIGGPSGLTAYARKLGDEVTRLDRIEPELNEAKPGDPRDTTAPAKMLAHLQAFVLGDALSARSKELMIGWLLNNKTGNARIRAGVPAGWRVGDKTGGGDNGTANDVAIVWPPGRAPILIAIYLTGTSATDERRNAIHAEVARAVLAGI